LLLLLGIARQAGDGHLRRFGCAAEFIAKVADGGV